MSLPYPAIRYKPGPISMYLPLGYRGLPAGRPWPYCKKLSHLASALALSEVEGRCYLG